MSRQCRQQANGRFTWQNVNSQGKRLTARADRHFTKAGSFNGYMVRVWLDGVVVEERFIPVGFDGVWNETVRVRNELRAKHA